MQRICYETGHVPFFSQTMIISRIYISPDHNFYGHHGLPPGEAPSLAVQEAECVAGRGIRGDRFFDYMEDYKGQITFFSEEVFEGLCERLQIQSKPIAETRRNVIVRGLDLNTLIGHDFEIQGVLFHGSGECKPCHWMNHSLGEGAEKALRGVGGLRARILSDGILRPGDGVFRVMNTP